MESPSSRQPLPNRLFQPVNMVHHFNSKFLAHNLDVSPLPVSLGAGNDCLAWNSRTRPKFEQTDRRLGIRVELNDENVSLLLLVELPLYLLAERRKIDVLARYGLYIVMGASERETDSVLRQSLASTLLVVPARKTDFTPRAASFEGA